MEKTVLEIQFEKLMIHHICNLDISPPTRAKLFIDFHENANEYYDNLCDILYAVSTHAVRAPIWMTHSGEIYASTHKKNKSDLFLLSSDDVPDFLGDIVDQLELVFLCIYRATSKYFVNPNCGDNVTTMP